ncbi:hypothetical protein CEXT_27711 [Caerostris extrusa]|uniref:Uncharacterized protein n=1 Tax=Caerostris extrusa TaxID=172846 RepID=A0AAV4VAG4_CAEEX|nr:hypothetical protein CEXT_27711 [Caerostris extrusa]
MIRNYSQHEPEMRSEHFFSLSLLPKSLLETAGSQVTKSKGGVSIKQYKNRQTYCLPEINLYLSVDPALTLIKLRLRRADGKPTCRNTTIIIGRAEKRLALCSQQKLDSRT